MQIEDRTNYVPYINVYVGLRKMKTKNEGKGERQKGRETDKHQIHWNMC